MDGCHTTQPTCACVVHVVQLVRQFSFSPPFSFFHNGMEEIATDNKRRKGAKREKNPLPSLSLCVCVWLFVGDTHKSALRRRHHNPFFIIYLFISPSLSYTCHRQKKRGCINPEKGRNIDIISSKTVVKCTAAVRRVCDGAEMEANAVLKRFDKLEEKEIIFKEWLNEQLAFFFLTFHLIDCLLVSGSTIGKSKFSSRNLKGGKFEIAAVSFHANWKVKETGRVEKIRKAGSSCCSCSCSCRFTLISSFSFFGTFFSTFLLLVAPLFSLSPPPPFLCLSLARRHLLASQSVQFWWKGTVGWGWFCSQTSIHPPSIHPSIARLYSLYIIVYLRRKSIRE